MTANVSEPPAPRPIAHVTTVHPLRDPRIAAKEVPSLRAAGFDVRLVARHARSEPIEGGVPVLALVGADAPGARPSGARRLRAQRDAWRHLARLRPALVHLHDPELLPLGWLAQRRLGARVVYDRHEAYDRRGGLEGRALARLEAWAFGWLDHTVIAEASYADALPDAAPHTLVRNLALAPATLPLPKTRPSPGQPLRSVYAGTVSEARGLGVMLRALRRARAEGRAWHLTIAGRAPLAAERARAERFIRQHGLADHVTLVGWTEFVAPAALAPYLDAAHVGLCLLAPLANYTASMPTKLYDYLQHALPFVCSAFPLWQRFADATGAGRTGAPDNDAALFATVEALTGEAYAAHTEAAARAAPAYRWASEADALVALYRSLLG